MARAINHKTVVLITKSIRICLIAAEGGIILVGRHEVKTLVLRIDYHIPEKTRGGEKGANQQLLIRQKLFIAFDHMHKLQLDGNYCKLIARYNRR